MAKSDFSPMARRMAADRRVHRGEFDVLKQTVDELKVEVDEVRASVAKSVDMTENILVILKGFQLVAKAAKWITAVLAAAFAVWHAVSAALHLK